MAGTARAIGKVIKLGTKYGPQVWVATKALREPAKEAAHKVMTSERARKQAHDHAASLADGTILKVYSADQSLWLVFSGDTAVTVYPASDVPLTSLLRGADLTKRIRPGQPVATKDRLRDAATSALRRGGPGAIN